MIATHQLQVHTHDILVPILKHKLLAGVPDIVSTHANRRSYLHEYAVPHQSTARSVVQEVNCTHES